MVRSLMALAQNTGSEAIDIHAPDPTGGNIGRCYRMGFEDSDGSVNIDPGAAAVAIKMFKDRKKQ